MDEVVLIHPDLPDVEYPTNSLHARVLVASGWEPKPTPEPKPEQKPARPARTSQAAAGESTRTQES